MGCDPINKDPFTLLKNGRWGGYLGGKGLRNKQQSHYLLVKKTIGMCWVDYPEGGRHFTCPLPHNGIPTTILSLFKKYTKWGMGIPGCIVGLANPPPHSILKKTEKKKKNGVFVKTSKDKK